jgi:transposase-like protein
MEKREKVVYEKRSQKDYSMSFKLGVVAEIETGLISTTDAKKKYGIQSRSTVVSWLRKYGTFDWGNQTTSNMPKSKEQRLMELEAKVKLLEIQKATLEDQVERSDKKAIIFDMVTVLENAASTQNQTALDSYTLNGQTYTQSGTYRKLYLQPTAATAPLP